MRRIKLNLDLDLSDKVESILSLRDPISLKSTSIKSQQIFEVMPKLSLLNNFLMAHDFCIRYPSLMTMQPGTYGILHVDGNLPETIQEIKFNIPIKNGNSMITRWYDLSKTPYPKIDWNFDRQNPHPAEQWFYDNADIMVAEHCVESMILDAPHIFFSGEPHNVDGRHSTVERTILGFNVLTHSTQVWLKWSEAQRFADLVSQFNQNS